MKKVLLIRHGATEGNLQRRYIGRTDESLCEQGRVQAEQLAKQDLSAQYIFTSPALRTVQSAQILFPTQEYRTVEGLWETDFGELEGKSAAELAKNTAYRAWVDSGCQTPVPGGEGIEDFKARCVEAFLQTMETVPEEVCAAFVIHGGCIMAIMEACAQPKREFYAYHIENGSYIMCEYEDGTLRITGGAVC